MSATLGHSIHEIHSGTLTKMGGNIKNWNKRWMILRSNHTLQYYKEPSKPAKGTISLNDINFNVAVGDKSSCNWPKNCNVDYSLVLTTTSRTYYMFADTELEAEQWYTQFKKYAEEAGKARGTTSTLPSRYNKMGGKATDLATPTVVNADKGHTPKMYKKKDRRLPTKRFNTADDDGGDDGDIDISDDELNIDGAMDGQMDMQKFNQTSEMSLSIATGKEDSIYVLAGSSDSKPPPRVTSPNTNNNNGGSKVTSVVDVHESLYDLVGRINAGEDQFTSNNNDVDKLNMYDEIQRHPSVEQDMYEPVNSEQGLPHLDDCIITSPSKPLPIKYNSPMSPQVSLGALPPVPPPPMSSEVYEALDEQPGHQPLALYDEIERKNEFVNPSDSSDDDSDDEAPPIPPPIPGPRINTHEHLIPDTYYDNAPSLPNKPSRSPSPLPPLPPPYNDDEYYGNAPSLPSKPHPSSPPPIDENKLLKSPVPAPRLRINNDINEDAIYDDTVAMVTHVNSSEKSQSEVNGTHEANSSSETKRETEIEGNEECHVNGDVPVCPANEQEDSNKVLLRTSLKKMPKRVHSATTGSYDQGIAMFHKRAQCVSINEDNDMTDNVKQLLLEETLNQKEKTTLAQSLIEIEQQKQLASEERYKWERERLKLEEDRRKFEEEKRRFQEQMQTMQQQANVND